MKYVWEEELMQINSNSSTWKVQHHLKLVWRGAGAPVSDKARTYKTTAAWVTKLKDRKWDCQFVNLDGNRTFRTMKEAKAYAVAIVTLDN